MRFCSDKGIAHSEFLEWDEEDQAKQLAFLIEESTRCSMCGTQPWEWEENKRAYMPVHQTCQGCYVRESAKEGHESTPGTTVVLRPYSEELVEADRKRHERQRRQKAEEAAALAEEKAEAKQYRRRAREPVGNGELRRRA